MENFGLMVEIHMLHHIAVHLLIFARRVDKYLNCFIKEKVQEKVKTFRNTERGPTEVTSLVV